MKNSSHARNTATERRIDLSDLLGANIAFLPDGNTELQPGLIDAYCNKVGVELH